VNRVFREEKKYLISLPEALQACHRLAQVMHEDPHNGISGYPVRSLYFDTLDDRDFREKAAGVELRRKLRLRCYDPAADFAMLEMKQKQGASQLKRSLRVTREDAQALTRRAHAPSPALPTTSNSPVFSIVCCSIVRKFSLASANTTLILFSICLFLFLPPQYFGFDNRIPTRIGCFVLPWL